MDLKSVFEKFAVSQLAQEMANQGYKVEINDVLFVKNQANTTEQQKDSVDKTADEFDMLLKGKLMNTSSASELVSILPTSQSNFSRDNGFCSDSCCCHELKSNKNLNNKSFKENFIKGYKEGYDAGYDIGYNRRFIEVPDEYYNYSVYMGYNRGYIVGFDDGFNDGYSKKSYEKYDEKHGK